MGKPTKKELIVEAMTPLAVAKIPGLPVSVNHLWRHAGGGRAYKTRAAKEWHEAAVWCIRAGRLADVVYNKAVRVDIILYTRNKRRWDLDNRVKQCLDTLDVAGVILDDSQVSVLYVTRVAGANDETLIKVYAA